jgi:hypothetical protein
VPFVLIVERRLLDAEEDGVEAIFYAIVWRLDDEYFAKI